MIFFLFGLFFFLFKFNRFFFILLGLEFMILSFFVVFIFYSGFHIYIYLCVAVLSSTLGLVLMVNLVYYSGSDYSLFSKCKLIYSLFVFKTKSYFCVYIFVLVCSLMKYSYLFLIFECKYSFSFNVMCYFLEYWFQNNRLHQMKFLTLINLYFSFICWWNNFFFYYYFMNILNKNSLVPSYVLFSNAGVKFYLNSMNFGSVLNYFWKLFLNCESSLIAYTF